MSQFLSRHWGGVQFSHISVSVAAGRPTLACQTFTAKLAADVDNIEEIRYILIEWLEGEFDYVGKVKQFLSLGLSPRKLSDFSGEVENIAQNVQTVLQLIKQRLS